MLRCGLTLITCWYSKTKESCPIYLQHAGSAWLLCLYFTQCTMLAGSSLHLHFTAKETKAQIQKLLKVTEVT